MYGNLETEDAMEPIEMSSNFEKPPIRRNKNKRLKRVFLTCLYAVISVIVLTGAYLSYKYFFPSDKQLFVPITTPIKTGQKQKQTQGLQNRLTPR